MQLWWEEEDFILKNKYSIKLLLDVFIAFSNKSTSIIKQQVSFS